MKYFGWVLLFFAVVYILPLGSRPLVLPEYGFAESAREMVMSGDYVTPRLRGETVYGTPAPAYYPAAKGIQLFGKNSFAVRFPAALAAGLSALFIWILISQVLRDEKLAALSAVIYLTFSGVYFSGTVATAGMLFAMLTTGSCGTFFTALQESCFNRRKILNLILCGAFMGLGFLVNGFEAVFIPLLSGIAYVIWDKKLRALPLALIIVLLISALLALPWLLAINRAEPGYVAGWMRESFASIGFRSDSGRWCLRYLAFFVAGAFPAILLVPAAGVVGKEAWKGFLRQPLFRFAFCFMFTPLILLAFTPKWNISGLLCSFAPLALLIAAGVRTYFNSGGHHRSYNWMMTAWGILLVLGGGGLIALRYADRLIQKMVPVTELFYPVMGTVLIIAGAVMIYSTVGNWRGRLYLFFFSIGVVLLFLPWFFRDSNWMPGGALQGINRRYQPSYSKRFSVVCETPALADAAAWEFEQRNVRSNVEWKMSRSPLLTPQILMIRFPGSEERNAAGKPYGDGELVEQIINVEPLQMMLIDLTKPAEKP